MNKLYVTFGFFETTIFSEGTIRYRAISWEEAKRIVEEFRGKGGVFSIRSNDPSAVEANYETVKALGATFDITIPAPVIPEDEEYLTKQGLVSDSSDFATESPQVVLSGGTEVVQPGDAILDIRGWCSIDSDEEDRVGMSLEEFVAKICPEVSQFDFKVYEVV